MSNYTDHGKKLNPTDLKKTRQVEAARKSIESKAARKAQLQQKALEQAEKERIAAEKVRMQNAAVRRARQQRLAAMEAEYSRNRILDLEEEEVSEEEILLQEQEEAEAAEARRMALKAHRQEAAARRKAARERMEAEARQKAEEQRQKEAELQKQQEEEMVIVSDSLPEEEDTDLQVLDIPSEKLTADPNTDADTPLEEILEQAAIAAAVESIVEEVEDEKIIVPTEKPVVERVASVEEVHAAEESRSDDTEASDTVQPEEGTETQEAAPSEKSEAETTQPMIDPSEVEVLDLETEEVSHPVYLTPTAILNQPEEKAEGEEASAPVKEETPEEAEARAKKKKKRRTILKVVGAVAAVGLVIAYFGGSHYFQTHFYPNTSVNGVDVSYQTPEEVRSSMAEQVESYQLDVLRSDGQTDTLTSSDMGISLDWDYDIDALVEEQNGLLWPYKLYRGDAIETHELVRIDQKQVHTAISQLECMSEAMQVMPQDACISEYTEDGFVITPEVAGTAIDETVLTDEVEKAVEALDTDTISLEDVGAYYQPTVYSDDEDLAKTAEALNSVIGASVTLTIGDEATGGETLVVDATVYKDWYDISEDYSTVTLNEDKVKEFVKGLADKYDTYGKSQQFVTHDGQTVTIDRVEYGWELDQETEVKALISAINNKTTETRDLNWLHTAVNHNQAYWGNSYMEVDLIGQMVYMYIDGECVISSKCVTGCTAKGNGTPAGIYSIFLKRRNAVLRGRDYETPVKYWMKFVGGIGFHDAWWRSSFGGTIYKNSGSHGCVNLPTKVAAQIYEKIYLDMPVLVYEK